MAYSDALWDKAREMFANGATISEISDATGINANTIRKRKKWEKWEEKFHKNSSKNENKSEMLLMDKYAKAKYDEIVAYLKKVNKYENVDNVLIERYARAYSLYIRHYAIIIREGAVIESDKGNKYIHPANMIMQQASNTMEKLEKQLGIGAYSRNRLAIQEQEVDEFLEFLKGDK